jgi:hypothetical protein
MPQKVILDRSSLPQSLSKTGPRGAGRHPTSDSGDNPLIATTVPRSASGGRTTDRESVAASVSEPLASTARIAQTLAELQFQLAIDPQSLSNFAVSKG